MARLTALSASNHVGPVAPENPEPGAVWYDTDEPAAAPAPRMPTGVITPVGGATAPDGSLLCDGGTFSSDDYPELAAYLGDTHGTHTGTTYHLPNLKGKVPVGLDTAQNEFNVLAETGGEKAHTLSLAEIPNATGAMVAHGTISGWWSPSGVFSGSAMTTNYESIGATGGANSISTLNFDLGGGGGAHNNLQPYVVLNYVIWT